MKLLFTAFLAGSFCLSLYQGKALAQHKTEIPELRTGPHNFTLQWIGWDRPGTVSLRKKSDHVYFINGEQVSRDSTEYVTIEGTIEPVSATELLFKGTIKSVVNEVNKGNVCKRLGVYHFKASGKRKYWRLQEMTNCEGNNLVDYIDIYF